MIARGFILLGFRASGMRTGCGSLCEDDALLALKKVSAEGSYGVQRAYHLIFDLLSKGVSTNGRIKTCGLTLIFCTVVMILDKASRVRLSWQRITALTPPTSYFPL